MKLFVKHIVLLALLLANMPGEAAIWRVNPDPSSGAQFVHLQDANDSPLVFDGDEIHVESNADEILAGASPYSATIDKQLIIKGPGFLLDDNFGAFDDMDDAFVDLLHFQNGSGGSTVSGLTISNLIIDANGVTVSACSVESTTVLSVNSGTLFGNYMQGVSPGVPVLQIIDGSNLYVAHCIILHDNAFTSGQNAVLESGFASSNEYNHCLIGNANSQIFSGLVRNCIFKSHVFDDIEGTEFNNNIFEIGFPPVAMFNPAGSTNDEGPITMFPSNILDVDLNTVFFPPVSGGFFESQYDIVPGSIADGSSDDSPPDNIGVFTVDVDGYSPSGQGSLPIVVDLSAMTYSDTYLLPVTYSAFSDGTAPIVQAEYYFDNDPGFGLASPVPVTAALSISDGFFAADISALSDGFHTIGIRVLDGAGVWSLTEFDEFEKIGIAPLPSLSLMSYELNDAGFSAAIDLDNPNDGDTEGIFFEIFDLSGLPEGIHRIRFRATDAFGFQGITYTTHLLVLPDPQEDPDLTTIEYFLDVDPGFGLGQQIPIQPGLDLFDGEIDYVFDEPTLGPHNLWVRFKDVEGNWSVAHVQQIHIVDSAFEALDADNDCDIDVADLLALLGEFGCADDPLDPGDGCAMDANQDGLVNVGDVLLFLGLYGETCESLYPGTAGAQNPDEVSAAAQ